MLQGPEESTVVYYSNYGYGNMICTTVVLYQLSQSLKRLHALFLETAEYDVSV